MRLACGTSFRGAVVRGATTVCAGLALASSVGAQQIGPVAMDARIPAPPTVATALGRGHLVYELHVTNMGRSTALFRQLEVMGDTGGAVLAAWSGPPLWQRTTIVGQVAAAAGPAGTLAPGARAVVYLWITLPPGAVAPAALIHRLSFALESPAQSASITLGAVPVSSRAVAIDPPIGDGTWVAVRGPAASSGHRLSLVSINGRTAIPQRFAVDFAKLGEDGLLFRGGGRQLAEWYAFGEPVYAVSDGQVAFASDGQPDRAPFATAAAVLEPHEATGNTVILDLGQGRFATFAHLLAGSVRLAAGDRVAAGDVLGRIGNSGHSLGPHLHFHLSDAAAPLDGEGVPFVMRAFTLLGRAPALSAQLEGTPWLPTSAQPAREVTGEIPLEGMVIRARPSLPPKTAP